MSVIERSADSGMEVTSMILLHAVRVHKYGNGLIGIELPVRHLPEAEAKMIHNMFPNLEHKVHELLDQEALLDALHTGPLPPNPKGRHDIIECYAPDTVPVVKPKY